MIIFINSEELKQNKYFKFQFDYKICKSLFEEIQNYLILNKSIKIVFKGTKNFISDMYIMKNNDDIFLYEKNIDIIIFQLIKINIYY